MSNENKQEVIESTGWCQPKQKRCGGCFRNCLKGCLTVVLVAAVPFWWFCLHTAPLRISKETTYVTSPLTADGKWVDYVGAFEERYYPPEMKTDDNGYRVFIRTCCFHRENETEGIDADREKRRLRVYEKLGLDPNIKPTMTLEEPQTFLKRSGNAKDVERYWTNNTDFWTSDDFPKLKDWLAENTAAIDLLGETVRKPVFTAPLVFFGDGTKMIDLFLLDALCSREAAYAASCRARYRIGIGDIDGAIDDAITIHHLARHASRHGMAVNALIGIAIDNMAVSIGINANPEHPATKEQLERYLKEFDALPPMVTFAEAMESEQFFCRGILQDFFASKDDSACKEIYKAIGIPANVPTAMVRRSVDANIAFAEFNRLCDAGWRNPAARETGMNAMLKLRNPFRYVTVQSRSKNFGAIVAAWVLSQFQPLQAAYYRNECMIKMQRLTLALLLYEKEHGKLPEGDWQAAIKPYLGENAEKCFCCPVDNKTVFAMVQDGGDLLLVETLESNTVKTSAALGVGVPNEPDFFKSSHIGSYNAACRNGATRAQSTTREK